MRRMPCALVLLFAVAATSCSDDDEAPMLDAGPDAAAVGGSEDGGGIGAGGNGSRSDNFPCESYPPEAFRWPDAAAEGMARRAPLDTLCAGVCNPGQMLKEFEARVRCVEPADDGGVDGLPDEFDGGVPSGPWRRSEGCGSIQFSMRAPNAARLFNFDWSSGELIGVARFDASGILVADGAGVACRAPAWVGGVVRGACVSETVSVCEVR